MIFYFHADLSFRRRTEPWCSLRIAHIDSSYVSINTELILLNNINVSISYALHLSWFVFLFYRLADIVYFILLNQI